MPQNYILWHNQILAGVKPPIIDLKNVESTWVSFGKLFQKPLIALGIDRRKLQDKKLSACRFNRAIEPKCFTQPLLLNVNYPDRIASIILAA